MRAVQPPPPPPTTIDDYEDYEEDNWGGEDDYEDEDDYEEEKPYIRPEISRKQEPVVEYEYEDDVEADAWADDEAPKPYKAPKVNIPEKTKTPEYEEEAGY
jgi:hypothetical protein